MRIRARSDVVSSAGRAAHDLALGAIIGGNLFGRMAMHPALTDVSDKTERGKVLNRAWRRYGTVNSLALGALLVTWLPARVSETRPRWLSTRERRLAMAKDLSMGGVALTGLASAVTGIAFSQQAPGGAVPMSSGHDPAAETPARAATIKRVLNIMSAANLAAAIALVGVNSALAQANVRRPPLRRVLRHRY